MGRRVLKEEQLGGCGARLRFGQALLTGDTPSHLLLPQKKKKQACIRLIRSSPRFSHTTCFHHSSPHTHPSPDMMNRRNKLNPCNLSETSLSHINTHCTRRSLTDRPRVETVIKDVTSELITTSSLTVVSML